MTHIQNPRSLLDRWVKAERLRPIDRAFARFLQEAHPEASPLLIVAAAQTSFLSGHGHTCLDIDSVTAVEDEPEEPQEPGQVPDVADSTDAVNATPSGVLAAAVREHLLNALRFPALTATTGDAPLAFVDGARPRLYLKRHYRNEQTIRRHVMHRIGETSNTTDAGAVRAVLERLFTENRTGETPDWAGIACSLALRSLFSVVTGGPGTGKTTVVVRILAAIFLLEGTCRVRLAAPTGKAATRLQDSIRTQLPAMPAEVRDAIPQTVTTIHKLLGVDGRRGTARYHAGSTLPADVVVIDEASMIDVELTARLLEAIPERCRVILLGDKDQLASVEAGAVLADLCLHAEEGRYTGETVRWVEEATGESIPHQMRSENGGPLDQAVAMLRYSHRFSRTGGIGVPAEAIRSGNTTGVPRGEAPGFGRLPVDGTRDERFRRLLEAFEIPVSRAVAGPPQNADAGALDAWALEILRDYGTVRVLCAIREGPWGVYRVNEMIRILLQRSDIVPEGPEWYPGRPVIVTRNDYRLNLMNGDVGVALPLPGGLRVAFEGNVHRPVRWVLPRRLQAVETVFAMTVHKSQGSEFERVVLVLPDRDVPVLTRELIYTGITRARSEVTLVEPDPTVLEKGVRRRVTRAGGLGVLLHDEDYDPPTTVSRLTDRTIVD